MNDSLPERTTSPHDAEQAVAERDALATQVRGLTIVLAVLLLWTLWRWWRLVCSG